MIILRQKYYSKKDKDKSEKDKAKKVGTGLVVGGIGMNTLHSIMSKKHSSDLENKEKYADESKRLSEKLKQDAKDRGVKIHETKVDNRGPFYNMIDDTVYLNGSKDSASLSHELGHRHYTKEKSGKVGNIAHKGYKYTGGALAHMAISPVAAHFAGKASGKSKARKEEAGEKENKVGKAAPIAAPLLVSTPGLVSEAAASRKGLKMLKESGASKEMMKKSNKALGHAFGTYAALNAANVGVGLLSKSKAYKKEKARIEKEKKKSDE